MRSLRDLFRRPQPPEQAVAATEAPGEPPAEPGAPVPTTPTTAAMPCPQCATGHLLAQVDLPLKLSVHLTRQGEVRPAEVLTTKRELQHVTRRDFTPLADDVPLTCSECDYANTVGGFRST